MNLLVICKLKDIQVFRKLEPLTELETVDNIFLIRTEPIQLDKVKNYCPPKILRKNMITAGISRFLIAFLVLLFKKVDVVMGIFLVPHGVIAGVLGKLFGKPTIQNIIGIDLHRALKNKSLFRFIKVADIVITRGPLTKQLLVGKGINPNIIFSPPNVFDFNKIPAKSNNHVIYDLIFVGSLEGYKRIDILLRAVEIAVRKYQLKQIKLALVGDGTLRQKLEKQVKDIGIDKNVVFLGRHYNVYPFLYQSKVFIMTSEAEGLPMAMIEAMSCGLPAIVPDDSDITSVAIHNSNALVVPKLDAEAFAEAICKVLTNQTLYRQLSETAFKIREEKRYEYSMNNIKSIWQRILEQLSL